MKYDAEGRKSLDQVQMQAASKLAEINRLLAPEATTVVDYEELQRTASERLAKLPPVEREALKVKAMVAYGELQQLMSEMSRHLTAISDELRKVNHHSRAAVAYGQMGGFRARSRYVS
jgi:hypothetical protein